MNTRIIRRILALRLHSRQAIVIDHLLEQRLRVDDGVRQAFRQRGGQVVEGLILFLLRTGLLHDRQVLELLLILLVNQRTRDTAVVRRIDHRLARLDIQIRFPSLINRPHILLLVLLILLLLRKLIARQQRLAAAALLKLHALLQLVLGGDLLDCFLVCLVAAGLDVEESADLLLGVAVALVVVEWLQLEDLDRLLLLFFFDLLKLDDLANVIDAGRRLPVPGNTWRRLLRKEARRGLDRFDRSVVFVGVQRRVQIQFEFGCTLEEGLAAGVVVYFVRYGLLQVRPNHIFGIFSVVVKLFRDVGVAVVVIEIVVLLLVLEEHLVVAVDLLDLLGSTLLLLQVGLSGAVVAVEAGVGLLGTQILLIEQLLIMPDELLLKILKNIVLVLAPDDEARDLEIAQQYRQKQVQHDEVPEEDQADEEEDGDVAVRLDGQVHHLLPLVADHDLEHRDDGPP